MKYPIESPIDIQLRKDLCHGNKKKKKHGRATTGQTRQTVSELIGTPQFFSSK